MALDLSEGGKGYEQLLEHVDHEIECVTYGHPLREAGCSVVLECVTCGEILVGFDRDDKEPPNDESAS